MGRWEAVAIVASFSITVAAMVIGNQWLLSGGGDWPALVTWSLSMLSIGGLLSWAFFGTGWKSKAQEVQAELENAEADLEFAQANAKNAMTMLGQDLADVELRRNLLATLSTMDEDEAREYLCKRLENDNGRYGPAVADLERYGCVEGVSCVMMANEVHRIYFGAELKVVKEKYPSLSERATMDLDAKMDEKAEAKVYEVLDEMRRLSRM